MGEIAPVSLELLGKARELADELDGRVCALLFGHEIADLAEQVIHHGADLVLLADHPELAIYRTLPYARSPSTWSGSGSPTSSSSAPRRSGATWRRASPAPFGRV